MCDFANSAAKISKIGTFGSPGGAVSGFFGATFIKEASVSPGGMSFLTIRGYWNAQRAIVHSFALRPDLRSGQPRRCDHFREPPYKGSSDCCHTSLDSALPAVQRDVAAARAVFGAEIHVGLGPVRQREFDGREPERRPRLKGLRKIHGRNL